jgi:hypothetical protein
MPGKHAPTSSKTFYISLGASILGAVAALGVVLGLVFVALNAGGDDSKTGSPAVTRPPSPAPTKSTVKATASSTAAPVASVLPASRVSTAVLNGTKRNGLAGSFAADVRKAGYPVLRTTNAPREHAKSTIYYRAEAQDEALAFQQRFPRFTVIAPLPANYPSDVLLTVVVGADFS